MAERCGRDRRRGTTSMELVFNFDVCGAKSVMHYSMESVALRRGRRFLLCTVHFWVTAVKYFITTSRVNWTVLATAFSSQF